VSVRSARPCCSRKDDDAVKLISFAQSDREGFGAVVGGVGDESEVVDLSGLAGATTLVELLAADALDAARDVVERGARSFPLSACRLLPPIPRPTKILCVGVNYVAHAEEAGRDVGEYPVIFQRYAETLVPTGGALLRPRVSEQFDYEGELAAVIGIGGAHIDPDDAMRHVAGFACFNDASVRDWQFHTRQYGMGKNFLGSGGFGPWLVTTDEIPDHRALRLRTIVSGEEMQNESVAKLAFDIPYLVSYTSQALPWYPGDVLSTGTPSGVGFTREPPRFLKDGDRVDVVIDGVGTLSNDVIDEGSL
jgi:2-keto-4-pentenoate hydratase/2-oxohepta-3-ene-1,7-dioic acid hydratase in catechol pathway